MEISDFKSLPLDELWNLREAIVETLAAKMTAEKRVIENRLRKLNSHAQADQIGKARQSYRAVIAKYGIRTSLPKLGQGGANNLVG